MTEAANIVYGRLKEAMHISGHAFGRGSEWLETLLADDAWRTVGPGFSDVNEFLRSIDLSPFALGDRPALVRRIKELQPGASNRAIANAAGVDEKTVRNDLRPPADYSAPEPDDEAPDLGEEDAPADYSAPEPEFEFDGWNEPDGTPAAGGADEFDGWSEDELGLLKHLQAGETIVLNLRGHPKLINWADYNDLFVRIDRRSDWGNPFETPADGDRFTVISNYAEHYLPCKPSLLARVGELRGKALGCWCAPAPCHGDVLKTRAER